MTKILVICESPAKIKKIQSYLGSNYIVKASFGHIRDLDRKELSVDLENNFKPKYISNPDKSKVISELKKAMKECYRVLNNGGIAIFSVPLSGKPETWEPPVGMSVPEIEAIVGWDHKRFYGYDFADKLEKIGFQVEIFRITEAEAKRHGIGSGDINDEIFIAKK